MTTTQTLRMHLAAAATADLINRRGQYVPLPQAQIIGLQIADAIISQVGEKEPPPARYDLNQAILVIEQEIDEVLQRLNGGTDERLFWQMRLESCRNALAVLKWANLPNPPAA